MILSKTGSLYRQPNLFRLFLSTSSVLEHELKTHISDVLKTVYLLLMQIGCFHIYKKFFQSCNKSHPAVQIWCGKRDNHFSRRNGKGVRLMKPSDFQKTVQCRFESCLKKVVRHVVKDYQQGLKRRKDKEIPFCELPEIVVEKLAVWDEYETDYTIFNVCGNDIRVYDDELAEALKKLPERKRDNVLMYYFLELSDTKIADILNITRSGAFRSRYHALEALKKSLKEEK